MFLASCCIELTKGILDVLLTYTGPFPPFDMTLLKEFLRAGRPPLRCSWDSAVEAG